MKNLSYLFFLPLMIFLTSCEAIGQIFEAGVWSGVIIVVAVIALIFWLLFRRKK